MDSENVVCPVCTLFLRPGITLKSHLTSHPKHKVIEALVRLSAPESSPTPKTVETTTEAVPQSTANNPAWNQNALPASNFNAIPGNHSFIYQQFMSSTSPSPQANVLNINPLTQQQVVTIPTVFNSQMMCPPYVYQQQQVIMSSGPSIMPLLPRSLPIELPATSEATLQEHVEEDSPITIENEDEEEDEPELVTVTVQKANMNINIQVSPKPDENNSDQKKSEIDLKPNKFEYPQKKEEDDAKKSIDCETDAAECTVPSDEFVEHNTESTHSNGELEWNVNNDLDKSCQTQMNSYIDIQETEILDPMAHCKSDGYYPDSIVSSADYTVLQSSYNEQEPTYTVAENHNENIYTTHTQDSSNIIDMDRMNILINNEFLNNQLVSQVEDFDCVSSERPRVLMNIGGIDTNFTDHNREVVGDESMSRESANIRADEHMPPRGELSGQESNGGTSDLNWNRVQYHEGSCGISYDLIARETWDGSDMSDADVQPAQNQTSPPPYSSYENDDTPTVSGFREPPITYKCPSCNESFTCPKERRLHQKEKHDEKNKSNEVIIGSQVGIKRVKKLVIKPKKADIKTENNFDNVFTNKLKIENNVEGENFDRVSNNSQQEEDADNSEEVLVSNPLICTMCDTVLPDSNALKEHQLEVHKFASDIRHKCSTCDKSFPNEIKYTEHLKMHPLECRLCGKYFYRRPNMQLHMKRHLGIRPYRCNICQKAFLTKQKHDEHKNIHTGNAPIKCNLCDETFRRHSNLVQHRNRHHFNLKKKLKDYVCYCGEIFHSKKKLAWHKEIHDAKPKACTQCSEKFIHMSSLTRHMRRAHNERFVPNDERHNENVECPVCKGVYLRSSLDVHIRNHSGQRPYTCLICNKTFTTKWNLKLHKWTHASRMSKPFKCDQCKGAFIRESDYVAHMNSHKSIKPYTCNYCGTQFIRKYNCQRHVREHEKDKTFSCQICNKTFHRSYYLKDHMRVHSGVRPYACHICGKTSTTKSNHNKHVRIHHAREPVSTEN